MAERIPVGRFAPSPSGRMHLGNIFTALISWLSVKSRDGKWILRIEDLDPQRSRMEYARQIEDDLLWLGLEWDEGGINGDGPSAPYMQSLCHDRYEAALSRLEESGLVYRCRCRRADIHAAGAPHASDGRIVYSGRCRPERLRNWPDITPCDTAEAENSGSWRLFAPEIYIGFTDRLFGRQRINLAREFGDFLLRRSDGAWAYQLAVVDDDARMGVTEIVRGQDLLSSSAPQIYLYRLLGYEEPEWAHVPLICNHDGIRLSKRDASLSMASLRESHTPEQLIGRMAQLAGLQTTAEPCSAADLLSVFSWDRLTPTPTIQV